MSDNSKATKTEETKSDYYKRGKSLVNKLMTFYIESNTKPSQATIMNQYY